MKNNPFQNFNNKYNPDERSLELLLSQLDSVEIAMPNRVKSPLFAWAWAGGVSIVGAAAAIIIFISGGAHTNVNIAQNTNMTTRTSKANNITNIDQALATVSSIEGVTDPNKF